MSFIVPALAWVGSALGASSATAAATGALAIGTGVSAIGSLRQGQAQRQAADYNAAIAQQNAVIAQQQGIAAVEAQQRNAARTIGAAKAAYGASGVQVDSGSPLDVLAESARMAELDKLTTKYNYDLRALGFDQQSNLASMNGKNATTSSLLNAGGSMLKGFTQYSAMNGTPIPSFGSNLDGFFRGTGTSGD